MKLLFWGAVIAIGYFYFKGYSTGKLSDDNSDEKDYITIKVPNKKKGNNDEELTDYEEIDK